MLLGIIGILAWGWGLSHKMDGHGFRKMTTLLRQSEQVELPMQNLSKLHGVLGIEHQIPLSVIKQKKWMQYQNIII
jgi:hypothetical protein